MSNILEEKKLDVFDVDTSKIRSMDDLLLIIDSIRFGFTIKHPRYEKIKHLLNDKPSFDVKDIA